MPEPEQSESRARNGTETPNHPELQQALSPDAPHQPQARAVWLPFGLFVLGFAILVTESKYTLSAAADYALKGLGAALCLVTVVWVRRAARKSGMMKRRQTK